MPASSATARATPRVSIVTPSYNQGQFVERTILSVLNQDYPNLQYIFVDALSSDSTPAILERYRKQIDIIIQEKDAGQSDALNKGFARADGDILAYINADDCYSSASIVSSAVAELSANPKTDLVYGRRYYISEAGFFHHCYPFRPFNKDQLYSACYLAQECCFWTKRIFDKIGRTVNKDLHFALDYELWLRFLEEGATFTAVDQVYALFRWYPGQKSNAEWESRGLPEIAALQEKFLGRAVNQGEMSRIFMEHYSGFHQRTNPAQADLFESLWEEETLLKQKVLGFAPLDHWMFERQLPERKEAHAF